MDLSNPDHVIGTLESLFLSRMSLISSESVIFIAHKRALSFALDRRVRHLPECFLRKSGCL